MALYIDLDEQLYLSAWKNSGLTLLALGVRWYRNPLQPDTIYEKNYGHKDNCCAYEFSCCRGA